MKEFLLKGAFIGEIKFTNWCWQMQLDWVCRVKEEPVSLISQPYQLLKAHE